MVAGSAAGMSGGDAERSRADFGHGPLFGRELDDSSFAGVGTGELAEFDAGGSEGGVAVDVFDDEDPHLVASASCWTLGRQCDLEARPAFGAGLEFEAAIVSGGDRSDERGLDHRRFVIRW
jgi:hypothetical protein